MNRFTNNQIYKSVLIVCIYFVLHHCCFCQQVNKSLEKMRIKRSDNAIQINNLVNMLLNHTSKKMDNIRAKVCAANLKSENNKNWTCTVEYQRVNNIKKPLFCMCSYSYECSETKKLYMSNEYSKNLRKSNQLANLTRGADYQCENTLNQLENKFWNCSLFKNKHFKLVNEAIYCKCLNKKTCFHERVVDFY